MSKILVFQMADDTPTDQDGTQEEGVDFFKLEVSMVANHLLQVTSPGDLREAMIARECLPRSRTCITNLVKVDDGKISFVQLQFVDPDLTSTISGSVSRIFPKAPDGAKFTLKRRFQEFVFRPQFMSSDWISAGALDLKVIWGI